MRGDRKEIRQTGGSMPSERRWKVRLGKRRRLKGTEGEINELERSEKGKEGDGKVREWN